MVPGGAIPVTLEDEKFMTDLYTTPTREVVTKKPITVDFDLILPSLEAGPKRNASYDPNYGYEPYWVQGDWVFDKNPYTKNATTHMCGIRCPQVYTEFGMICGRNKNFKYKTFENFCQLRNEDCSGVFRWTMVYKGKCSNAFVPYEPDNVHERAKTFIKEFHT